jgi:hypothetical protein
MRTIICAIALATAFSLVTVPGTTAGPADQAAVSPAARVVAQLVIPFTSIVSLTDYTMRSDPDGLLGLPGQYVSKARFYDSDGAAGNVEVFATLTDRTRREAALRATGQYPTAVNGRALLALDTYDYDWQVQAYRSAFYAAYVP